MEIDEKIKETEEKLKDLKEEKERIERTIRLSKFNRLDISVAELLHEKLCTHNHIDMCDWYYGEWDAKILNYSKKEYLKRAKKLVSFLRVFGFSESNMLDFVKNFIDSMH